MVKIISFAWTSRALIAERKTRTRRKWNDKYAKKFKKGDIIKAYDRSPLYGGRAIKVLRLTADPVKEDIRNMPNSDYEREGFKFMEENDIKIWKKDPKTAFKEWKEEGGDYYIIDFEFVKGCSPRELDAGRCKV